jgi:cobalamin biosynthesis protein CobT
MNRAIAAEAGLATAYLSPQDPNQCPRTNEGTIYVRTPDPKWEKAEIIQWFDVNGHECGHHLGVCKDVWHPKFIKNLNTNSVRGFVFNLVDDGRNDKLRCYKYLGMYDWHKVSSVAMLREVATKGWSNPGLDAFGSIMKVLLPFDTLARSVWNPTLENVDKLFSRWHNDIEAEQYRILTSDYFKRYCELETAVAELDFVDEILEKVFNYNESKKPKDDPPPPQPPDDEGEDEEGEKGESSEGEESKDGDPCDDGEPSEDTGEEKGGSEETESTVTEEGESVDGEVPPYTIPYEDIAYSDHRDSMDTTGTGISIDYSGWRPTRFSEVYSPHTDDTTTVVNLHRTFKAIKSSSIRGGPGATDENVQSKLNTLNISSMTARAKRYLQVETRKKVGFNKKKGKIHGTKLHRVLGANANLRDKVFKNKDVSKALDCALLVLVDASGSMYGEEINTAIAAAIGLESLCKTLKINVEIAAFTEVNTLDNRYTIAKEFNTPITPNNLRRNLLETSKLMVENADGDSILVAYHRILQQKQPRKIICVLSDGSPASGRGDSASFTTYVVKKVEDDPNVDILGIGILDSNVIRFYKNNYVVNKLQELPDALISTLKDCILRK